MTSDPSHFDENGKFKKGHKGFNAASKVGPELPPPPTDADTDFDAAVLHAAQSFGRGGAKPKVGLLGYCTTLMQTRPQDFAALVTKASARRAQASTDAIAAVPITINIVPCPTDFFMPGDEARARWSAKFEGRPVLVIDNEDDGDDNTADTTFTDDDTDDDGVISPRRDDTDDA